MYNYCNDSNGYIYLPSPDDLYTCTTVNNVEYFYIINIENKDRRIIIDNCNEDYPY